VVCSASGLVSFFREVREWPRLDFVIQCDFVKCFDMMDHELLLDCLRDDFLPTWLLRLEHLEPSSQCPSIWRWSCRSLEFFISRFGVENGEFCYIVKHSGVCLTSLIQFPFLIRIIPLSLTWEGLKDKLLSRTWLIGYQLRIWIWTWPVIRVMSFFTPTRGRCPRIA
jgi:hypothetical protein